MPNKLEVRVTLAIRNFIRKEISVNAAIFIFAWIYLFSWVPSATSSLGIVSLEDGPVLPSLVFKHKDYFQSDFRALETQHLIWTSSSKWAPALLYRYLNIDPVFLHFVLLFFQTFLIFLGTYKLARTFLLSKYFSILILGTFVVVKPYFINAGWYGDLQFMPYTTWLAIGPILIAWANFRDSKNFLAVTWLALGASFHPGMALVALILIIAIEYQDFQTLRKTHASVFLRLSLPVAFFGFLSMITLRKASDNTSQEISISNIGNIQHFSAWKMDPSLQTFPIMGSWLIQTITHITLLILVRKYLNKESIRILQTTIVITILALAIQAISYSLNITSIYSISFGRITIFSQIVIFIVLIKMVLENMESTDLILQLTLFMILFPAPVTCLVVTTILLFKSRKTLGRIQGTLILILLILDFIIYAALISGSFLEFPKYQAFLLRGFEESQNLLFRLILIYSQSYWIFTLIFLIWFFTLIAKKTQLVKNKASTIAILGLCVIATIAIQSTLSSARDSNNSNWIQVQEWAKQNTQANDLFLVNTGFNIYESWGTLSRRPRIILNSPAGYPYFYSREDKFIDAQVRKATLELKIKNWTSESYFEVGKRLGAKYAVFASKEEISNLTPCYRNKNFLIYSLIGTC